MNKEIKYQLASFELSKQLKDNGYNEYDMFYYRDSYESELKITPEINMIGKLYDNHNHRINILKYDAICTAPMLSNVQQWFRSEYNIHINPIEALKKWSFSIRNIETHDVPTIFHVHLNSYEEALEAGLKEALKLI